MNKLTPELILVSEKYICFMLHKKYPCRHHVKLLGYDSHNKMGLKTQATNQEGVSRRGLAVSCGDIKTTA